MGPLTSKGNWAKSKIKHPLDMTTPGFEHRWKWSAIQHATVRPRRRPATRRISEKHCMLLLSLVISNNSRHMISQKPSNTNTFIPIQSTLLGLRVWRIGTIIGAEWARWRTGFGYIRPRSLTENTPITSLDHWISIKLAVNGADSKRCRREIFPFSEDKF